MGGDREGGLRRGGARWAGPPHADALDAGAPRVEADDLVPVDHLDAELARGLRVSPNEGPREDDAVVRVVAGRLDAGDVELRHDAPGLSRREHPRREPA